MRRTAGLSPIPQPWGFIPLEIRIVSAEDHGLQAVRVRYNRAGNPLALHLEVLQEAVIASTTFR